MEENKQQQGEEQGKEAKKIEARFNSAMRKLTAVMGPKWEKTSKFNKDELPEIIQRIVQDQKEEMFKRFQKGYIDLVEKKKKLDKTITEKEREFQKLVVAEKKAFLAEVDALLAQIDQIDQIEREYYNTLSSTEEIEESSAGSEETQNP